MRMADRSKHNKNIQVVINTTEPRNNIGEKKRISLAEFLVAILFVVKFVQFNCLSKFRLFHLLVAAWKTWMLHPKEIPNLHLKLIKNLWEENIRLFSI